MNKVSEVESVALMCAPSESPNVTVIFILRGPERDCDNCTLHNGSSYWEVQGNASSCQLTVFNAQGSDSGDYHNFTCMCTHVEEIPDYPGPQQVNIFEVTTIVLSLVLIVLSLVLVILVVLLFTFAWKLYRKRTERLLDPPGKIFQSSTSLFSLICTITLADCVYNRKNRNCPATHS